MATSAATLSAGTSPLTNGLTTLPTTGTTTQPNTPQGTGTQEPLTQELKKYVTTNQEALARLAELQVRVDSAITAIIDLSDGFDKNIEDLRKFLSHTEEDIVLTDGTTIPNVLKGYNKIKTAFKDLETDLTANMDNLKASVTTEVATQIQVLTIEVRNFIKSLEAKDLYTKDEVNGLVNPLQTAKTDHENRITALENAKDTMQDSINLLDSNVSDLTLRLETIEQNGVTPPTGGGTTTPPTGGGTTTTPPTTGGGTTTTPPAQQPSTQGGSVQLPSLKGDLANTLTFSHYAYHYNEDFTANNKELEEIRFEIYKGLNLSYVKQFSASQTRTGTGTAYTLTESNKDNVNVQDGYKLFVANNTDMISLSANQELELEFKNPQMIHSFKLTYSAGFEATDLELRGYTEKGYNLLKSTQNSEGAKDSYTIEDDKNAYSKIKLTIKAHKGVACMLTAFELKTSNPPALTYTMKDTLDTGEYSIRIGFREKDSQTFTYGNSETKKYEGLKGGFGYVYREDLTLIKTIGLSYEEEWRLSSIASNATVKDSKSYKEFYDKLNIYPCLVDIATGDIQREPAGTTIDTLKTKLTKDTQSIMNRIPKLHHIFLTATFRSKTYEVNLISQEPFEITLSPEMFFGSEFDTSPIAVTSYAYTNHKDPQNTSNYYYMSTGTITNNNTSKVTIQSAIYPSFKGKEKDCEELFITPGAITNGLYRGEATGQSTSRVNHRTALQGKADTKLKNNSLMNYFDYNLLLLLENLKSQKSPSYPKSELITQDGYYHRDNLNHKADIPASIPSAQWNTRYKEALTPYYINYPDLMPSDTNTGDYAQAINFNHLIARALNKTEGFVNNLTTGTTYKQGTTGLTVNTGFYSTYSYSSTYYSSTTYYSTYYSYSSTYSMLTLAVYREWKDRTGS